MQAIILAAGKGTRLKPLTENKPKAMAEINQKPMLWFVLDSLEKVGIEKTVIVIGFLGEQIKAYFGKAFGKMQIDYAEQKQQLGTAHALLQAKTKIIGDFLMGHCDVIPSASEWKEIIRVKGFTAVMTLRKEQNPEKFGVVATKGKLVVEITEKPKKPKTELVNAACYKFSPKIFEELEKTKINPKRNEFELTDTLKNLLKEKKVGFVIAKEKIFDISSIDELKKAEKELKQNIL